jgi:hypothetical protein
MEHHNSTEINLDKTRLAKLLVCSVLFLVGGLWMIITDPQSRNPLFNSPLLKAFAFYGALIMGACGVYFFSRKLFDRRPGLIIDRNGIVVNTSIFSLGLIPWSDISRIYESHIQASMASKQYFVTVELIDPGKYISREKNALKKWLLKANTRNYGSPVHITTNGLQTNHKDLFQLLSQALEKYKLARDMASAS